MYPPKCIPQIKPSKSLPFLIQIHPITFHFAFKLMVIPTMANHVMVCLHFFPPLITVLLAPIPQLYPLLSLSLSLLSQKPFLSLNFNFGQFPTIRPWSCSTTTTWPLPWCSTTTTRSLTWW